MTKTVRVFAAAVAATLVAGGAFAQDAAFANDNRAQNAMEGLEKSIRDDAKRNVPGLSNGGRKLGWSGSFSARASMSKGNSDTASFGAGARMNHFDGVNGHRLTTTYSYAEKSGVATKDALLFGYDYTRDFGNGLYAFGKANVAYDKFDSYEYDGFVGAGLGYRVIDNATTQWAVQAGPGYRVSKDNNGVFYRSGAAAVSSYFKTQLTDTVSLHNDTDILWAKSNTRVTNELGMNVAMTDALALRTSLTTQYNSKPLAGFKNTDNTLGMSVVYNFN